MDSYFGIILFSWIVIAPTVGLVLLGRMDRRGAYVGTRRERTYHAPENDRATIAGA